MSFLTEEQKARIAQAEEKGDIAAALVEVKTALEKRDADFQAKMEELTAQVKAKADPAMIEATAKQVEELGKKAQDMNAEMLNLQQKFSRPAGGPPPTKSLGEIVAGDEMVQALAEGKCSKATVSLKTIEHKAVTSDAASAGALVPAQRLPGIVSPPDQQFMMRDLLMPGTTTSNAIEYAKESMFTNNAAPQANELDVKAMSDITFELETTTVKTIAHLMYASKQIMADASQLASYINGRLVYGLKYEEERQLLLGDGTGANLLGVIPQATAYDTALEATLGIAMRNKMDVLRTAMLQVQLALYPPSGIVLHPVDWASITLTKDANGNYLIANPHNSVSQMLWSLPVVASMSMTQGEFLVGAFRLGAQLFDREQANIAISYEDGDNFRRNAVTIRAEERLALAVYRPAAFVHGSFTATP